MSGVKTLINNCGWMLLVTLLARAGDNPQTPTVRRVCVNIGSGERKDVTYGDDQNPYMNGMVVLTTDGSMYAEQSWTVVGRGGSLDNLFNGNSVIEVGYNTATQSFTLNAHN